MPVCVTLFAADEPDVGPLTLDARLCGGGRSEYGEDGRVPRVPRSTRVRCVQYKLKAVPPALPRPLLIIQARNPAFTKSRILSWAHCWMDTPFVQDLKCHSSLNQPPLTLAVTSRYIGISHPSCGVLLPMVDRAPAAAATISLHLTCVVCYMVNMYAYAGDWMSSYAIQAMVQRPLLLNTAFSFFWKAKTYS